MGGAWVTGLKMLSKNICEGIHLTVKLPAISLQPWKFTKNELLHSYFSRISVRFEIIIYCAFSRNHLMEGCFTFQWGGVFQIVGASFLSGGCGPWGASVLIGRGLSKKIVGWGRHPPCPPSHHPLGDQFDQPTPAPFIFQELI